MKEKKWLTPVVIVALSLGAAFSSAQERRQNRDSLDAQFLRDAIERIRNESAGASESLVGETSDGVDNDDGVQEELRQAPAAEPQPTPDGASGHSRGREAEEVVGGVVRLSRRTNKAEPGAGEADFVSNSPVERPAPEAWRSVSSGMVSFVPQPGVDPMLQASLPGLALRGRAVVHGFLLLNEFPSEIHWQELEALGIQSLGAHGGLEKVRMPVDSGLLQRIAELPYVEWIGTARLAQKVSPDLSRAATIATESGLDSLPVVINLFGGQEGEERSYARILEETGAELGRYDAELAAYPAVVSPSALQRVLELDFVLFVEPVLPSRGGHDQSAATIGADYIRPGGPGTRFNGSPTTIGILDTGFMLGSAAATMHLDLNKNGCGRNFTNNSAGVWNDQNGHGTHVLGTIGGTGTADSRYRGVAIGIGNSGQNRIRAAKIWGSGGTGQSSWTRSAMDWMDDSSRCSGDSPRPQVVNISGGATGNGMNGTDSTSRKLDAKVWSFGQAYVVCSGNSGSTAQSIWSPGVAKNALTVGNVLDNGYLTVGDIRTSSSRGPTGDGRMKPNLVGPGTTVTSARAGTTSGYTNKVGCSMATPHVSGLAATLIQHYPEFRWRPHLLRAHLMATSILHDDVVSPANNSSGGRNTYGLGRVSSYVAHWARNNANGWSTHWSWGSVTRTTWRQRDIVVPSGTRRLVVVGTWDEPAASAGASQAVTYDLDLWVDRNADCVPDAKGQCGEYASQSYVDNTEYLIINNPPAGTYRLKMIPWNAPSSGVPVGIAATIIRGDPTPNTTLTASVSTSTPPVGGTFTVTTSVHNPAYIASGVHLARTSFPAGLTLLSVRTLREDGVNMDFGTASNLTLGNIRQGDSRAAVWTFRNNSATTKTLSFRSWSENGGTRTDSVTVGQPPTILSPAPGTRLPFSQVTFQWTSNGLPVADYWLQVGSSLGGSDIHNSGSLGTSLSRTVTGLPADGRRVYLRLWYRLNGFWSYADFEYRAFRFLIRRPIRPVPIPIPPR